MTFAIEYLNRMERKYPGVLAQISKEPDILSSYLVMRRHGIDQADQNLMVSLRAWAADKVIYNFKPEVAVQILNQTEEPDYEIPVSFMKHLPYPCIAISSLPVEVRDPQSDRAVKVYTGNAFIWLAEDNELICTWEVEDGSFDWSVLDLSKLATFNDCFDVLIRRHFDMAGIMDEESDLVLRLFRIERFGDLTELTDSHIRKLFNRLGPQKAQAVFDAIKEASSQEQLLQRVIHIILYLNCTNSDIEAAEEKMKAGAWGSIVGGEEVDHVPKTKWKQALRENEGTKVFDVGYRLGKFKRSYSSDVGDTATQEGKETGTRGYGKRRAHYHHFWVGPRKGPIAEDIMNPAAGERGLVLYWLDATEIHPELKDDLATVVDVERQEIDGLV